MATLQYSCLKNLHGQRSLWYYYQLTSQVMNVRLRECNSCVRRGSPAYLVMWASKTKLSAFEDLQKIINARWPTCRMQPSKTKQGGEVVLPHSINIPHNPHQPSRLKSLKDRCQTQTWALEVARTLMLSTCFAHKDLLPLTSKIHKSLMASCNMHPKHGHVDHNRYLWTDYYSDHSL